VHLFFRPTAGNPGHPLCGWSLTLTDRSSERYLSVYSYLELLKTAIDKRQQDYVHDFFSSFDFIALPLTENVGHRALIYIETYSLSNGLRAGDAIIAATAAENNMTLVSSNVNQFKPIKGLKLKVFKP
jgi:predicted nucleic acid-binding protein